MKKFFELAVVAVLALGACEKADPMQPAEEPGPNSKGLVTIKASIPKSGLATKVSFSEATVGGNTRLTKLSWEAADVISVNGTEFTIKTGTISADGLSATFQGQDPGAGPYTISYTDVPGDMNNQTQPADGDASNLGYSVSLTGANTYENVSFSSSWATEHGATLAQSSVLELRALLPEAIAPNVKKVIFKASQDVFNGNDKLTVTLNTPGTSGSDKKLNVYAMLPAGNVTLSEAMDLLVQFQVDADKEYEKYTAFRTVPSGTDFIKSGATQYLGIDCSDIASYANSSTESIGTAANPYLIGDKYQLGWLATNVANGKIYKLVDDIDATGFATSINPGGAITFDGNNKKISNLTAPLFDDLKGNVKDLTIYNAVVSSANTVGILANTCNTAASTVSGVTVTGDAPSGDPLVYKSTLTSTATTATKYVGGLVGEVSSDSSFDDCHVSNTAITAPSSDKTYAGGAFGYIHNENAKVGTTSMCTVQCSSLSAHNYAGGFIGYLSNGTIENNDVSCPVTANSTIGGLIGRIDAGTVNNNSSSGNVTGKQSAGGLIGYMNGGILIDNSATGNVTCSAYYVGGLVGTMRAGSIETSHASGMATSNNEKYDRCGGLVGLIEVGTEIKISDCYATGVVEGKGRLVGGLIGSVAGAAGVTISRCFATGAVSIPTSGTYDRFAGGLVGSIDGTGTSVTINDCYSTGAVFGGRQCGGLVGSNSATLSVSRGYTTSSVSASSSGPLIGNNGGTTTCSAFVAWSSATALAGNGAAISTDGNYIGTENSIYSQAVVLAGWDFEKVWTTDTTPKLR